MNKPKVLLTGDDGYASLGIRLLATMLRNEYDLAICATKTQQSAVGGKLSLQTKNLRWGKETVEGVPAIWVEGTPADSMEFAQGYFTQSFDCIISGINIGLNVGGHITSSGTFAAAWRGCVLHIAPHALALSWDALLSIFSEAEDAPLDAQYVAHPGETAKKIVSLCFSHSFWDAPLLNINFPQKKSDAAVFTRMLPDLRQSDAYPNIIDTHTHTFSYIYAMNAKPNRSTEFDYGAILAGKTSITPCTVFPEYENFLQGKEGNSFSLSCF